MGELRTHDPLSADWVLVVLLLVAVQLAWTNVASPKKWAVMLEGAFRARISRRSLREDIDLQDRSMLGLLSALLAGTALFLHEALVLRELLLPGLLSFILVFLSLAALLLVQVFLLRAIAWLFQGDGGLFEYTRALVLNHLVLGAALLPVAALVAYRPGIREELVVVGACIAAVVVLIRWGRAVLIGLSEGVPLRHIFLYLCTAEILPVLLALRPLGHAGTSVDHLP